MHLRGNIVRAPDVAPADRDAMFALMDRHYDNIDRDTFESDLAEKDWIIRINDPDTGALVGFSTQVLLSARVERAAHHRSVFRRHGRCSGALGR